MTNLSRREVMQLGLAVAAGVGLSRGAGAAKEQPTITRAIPSSGEKLPVIGLGTNRYGTSDPGELAARKLVLKRLPELGGAVVDTAPAYGDSEQVIGRLLGELGNR